MAQILRTAKWSIIAITAVLMFRSLFSAAAAADEQVDHFLQAAPAPAPAPANVPHPAPANVPAPAARGPGRPLGLTHTVESKLRMTNSWNVRKANALAVANAGLTEALTGSAADEASRVAFGNITIKAGSSQSRSFMIGGTKITDTYDGRHDQLGI